MPFTYRSDSSRDGRSGNRIPVGARFSAPVYTGPEPRRPGRGVNYPSQYGKGEGVPRQAEVAQRIAVG